MLALGIDLGTSGIRATVIDQDCNVVADARGPHRGAQDSDVNAALWWLSVADCLDLLMGKLKAAGRKPTEIARAAVDGTSGSMVLVDAELRPVTPALMYNSKGFDVEARQIASVAPPDAITRGANSAMARMLRLQNLDQADAAQHLLHQADFILARFVGRAAGSDDNNALKLGFDPETRRWPDYAEAAGVKTGLLPTVTSPGQPVARIAADVAERFGLSPDLMLHAGTTDSVAAFMASGACDVGDAVTSLGTTLAIKLLTPQRVEAPAQGVYSHRLGDMWLAGGASNTGGGVLAAYFTVDDLVRLSAQIDPGISSGLDYYPLIHPGERFPINDPDYPPRLSPRPDDPALFLHGMLEAIARIERDGYLALSQLGAPALRRVFTSGGGAKNPVWSQMRARMLGVRCLPSLSDAASVGVARLALQAGANAA